MWKITVLDKSHDFSLKTYLAGSDHIFMLINYKKGWANHLRYLIVKITRMRSTCFHHFWPMFKITKWSLTAWVFCAFFTLFSIIFIIFYKFIKLQKCKIGIYEFMVPILPKENFINFIKSINCINAHKFAIGIYKWPYFLLQAGIREVL